MQPNTALTIVDAEAPALYFGNQLAALNEVMRVNQGAGATFDIKDIVKIPFPGAGAGTWNLPGVDGQPQHVQEFEGVILAWQTHRGYFVNPYTGDNGAPDCYAEEPAPGEEWQGSVASNGKFGGACATCPIGRWRVENGSKIVPLCKPRIRVYIQVPGIALPVWMDLPSTSVPVFKEYMKALTRFGFPHYRVVTIFGLEATESKPKAGAKKGIAYSLLKPRAMRDPNDPTEQKEKKRVYLFSPLETTQIVERRNMILAMIDPATRAARRAESSAQGDEEATETTPDAASAYGINEDL